jgi:ABC-type polysaccharide transport system permease subunit
MRNFWLVSAIIITSIIISCSSVTKNNSLPTTTLYPHKNFFPLVVISNKTSLRLTIEIGELNRVIEIDSGKTKTISIFRRNIGNSVLVKVTAWDKKGFPTGSLSREIPTYANNSVSVWRIAQNDLEY